MLIVSVCDLEQKPLVVHHSVAEWMLSDLNHQFV